MKKKLVLLLMLTVLSVFLAGCGDFRAPISADSEGFWSQYIVWPLVSLIETFKGLLGTYGLGIIAVTIIIRLILLPLTLKQTKSSKQMQAIQPELKALKEKYKSKDAATQEKYRTEMQAVMSTNKVNPVAGCLPVIVQMPILIGFYHAISRMNATPEIPLGKFFMFDLAQPAVALAIFAGLMQFVVLRTGPAMDNPQMKIMMYIMPVFIMIFGSFLPAALALYWVVGNTFSIVQNFFIYKPFKKKEELVITVPKGKGGVKRK